MNNSQSWETNVHTLITKTVVLVIAMQIIFFFWLLHTGSVWCDHNQHNSNQYYSPSRWEQAWLHPVDDGYACPFWTNRWMPFYFSVIFCVDNTEQEQKDHKNVFSSILQSRSNKMLHTLFFAISQSSSVFIRWQLFYKRRERLAFTSGSTITWGCDIFILINCV